MKKISKWELAAIKRAAQNVNPMVTKKNKIKAKIAELKEEYDSLCAIQEQYEAPVKAITGGYTTEDIYDKVIEDTGKVDKDGKPIKVTKYVLKYPETVIPVPTEGPLGISQYDNNDSNAKCPSEYKPSEEEVESDDLPFMN